MTSAPPHDRPGRLSIGLVGAGRAGTPVAAALARAGHHVIGVAAVSRASRDRAAALLPRTPVLAAPVVVSLVDLVILAVPDDQLSDLVAGLAATGALHRGQWIAHLSGRHGLAVLEPAIEVGATGLAMHPVMTFTGTAIDLERMAGVHVGVTCRDSAWPIAQALVLELGGEPARIAEEHRALYHAALSLAANSLQTLVAASSALLAHAGVEYPTAMLAPLLSAALDNALRGGDTALTGPVARGDADTVRDHLLALARTAPDVLPAYRELARLSALRALDSGLLPPERAAALLAVLAGDPSRQARP